MHQPIRDRLEEHLHGKSSSGGMKEFRSHMDSCPECRGEVTLHEEQRLQLSSLRSPAEMDAAPGFYARVMSRVEAEGRPSLWNMLLDPVFGKRLVYATLAVVMMMSAYLAVTEPRGDYNTAESVLAGDTAPPLPEGQQSRREAILVNFVANSAPGPAAE